MFHIFLFDLVFSATNKIVLENVFIFLPII